MRVVFLDVTAPKPYDHHTLATAPQGGTESTVTRIAEGLAARGHEVTIGQNVRRLFSRTLPVGCEYVPYDYALKATRPDVVVCLRTPSLIPIARRIFPDAKPFLWLHDFNQNQILDSYPQLEGSGTRIICVSQTHKTRVASELISRIGVVKGVTVSYIYNPIADDLQPDATQVDPHKLVFFSSPHKGLDHALSLFKRLREFDPGFTLHVANPGYFPSADLRGHGDGLIDVGTLQHSEVVGHVRSALCVFHPNWVFPETFGLVHAEALAVGTPVLTTGLGANREIIDNPEFTCMERDPKIWIDRILKWRDERPKTRVNEEFRLSNVLDKWEEMIR
jgi:glycosyltransferase involved in cell wall biosynthesis